MWAKLSFDLQQRTTPESLYHYTTQEGFLGIVRSRSIWATHTQYLNDQREYLHAVEMVLEAIDALRRQPDYAKHAQLLDDMAADANKSAAINVCVCSFSEQRDSLSQWRAYGGKTAGYALGFLHSSLSTWLEPLGLTLEPCVYDRSLQRDLVRAFVYHVLAENTHGVPWEGNPPGDRLPRGGNMSAYLHSFAPLLKDPSFAEEKEWRVITRPTNCKAKGFGFRAGASMLIPYFGIGLGSDALPFALSEVVIGPTPHIAQSVNSSESFLVSQDVAATSVRPSSVPFRSW